MTTIPAPLPQPSARSLLITVLGELVYPDGGPVFTAALMHVLRGLGLEEHAARRAITRAREAGWIDAERHGRAVAWRLAAKGKSLVDEGLRRAAAFLAESGPWDGRWLVLMISVPQSQRTTRKRLYGGLAWLGLGNPAPGVWVTPHTGTATGVRTLVQDLELSGSALAFTGTAEDIGLSEAEMVRRAWDLDDLAARYELVLARYAGCRPAPGDELLLTHLEMLSLLQRFMRLDPRLPAELLPDGTGQSAVRLFRDRRLEWSGPARERWRQIVQEASRDQVYMD